MNITIIGKNSFLAQALRKNTACKDWRFLGHEEALQNTGWIKDTDVVFNLAYHPDLKQEPYSADKDIDLKLAALIKDTDIHYMMASSRTVYGSAPDDLMLREDLSPKPDTPYGRNKWQTEQALQKIFGDKRLTILRMANICGSERGRKNFFGMALTKLYDTGTMEFDIAPEAQRDFLPVSFWANAIIKILTTPKPGLYNLGSGIGITTQEIADWLIEGHGSGSVNYTAHGTHGQFIMDMGKAKEAFDLDLPDKTTIREFCKNL